MKSRFWYFISIHFPVWLVKPWFFAGEWVVLRHLPRNFLSETSSATSRRLQSVVLEDWPLGATEWERCGDQKYRFSGKQNQQKCGFIEGYWRFLDFKNHEILWKNDGLMRISINKRLAPSHYRYINDSNGVKLYSYSFFLVDMSPPCTVWVFKLFGASLFEMWNDMDWTMKMLSELWH